MDRVEAFQAGWEKFNAGGILLFYLWSKIIVKEDITYGITSVIQDSIVKGPTEHCKTPINKFIQKIYRGKTVIYIFQMYNMRKKVI